jgi:hypothetical protein
MTGTIAIASPLVMIAIPENDIGRLVLPVFVAIIAASTIGPLHLVLFAVLVIGLRNLREKLSQQLIPTAPGPSVAIDFTSLPRFPQ